MFTTLIESDQLAAQLNNPNWVIVDCRFDLADVTKGHQAYLKAHIPGAVYADLDHDMSGPPVTDAGRHPLPTPAAMTAVFERLGISTEKQVVIYDDRNGVYASRLWWMLRYMGHDGVAVLAGGWPAWQAAGLPEKSGEEVNETAVFIGSRRAEWLVQKAEVLDVPLLIDSRAPARYLGEMEPLDPIAGHIPGAANFFFQQNWDENGRYRTPENLKEQFETLLDNTNADDAVFYCGSGVSACVNLLALAHSGVGNGRLYVGSWSEWSNDPDTPKATGK